MDDATIHRVSGKAIGQGGSLICSKWIVTDYSLVLTTNFVIAENDSAKVQFFYSTPKRIFINLDT